MKKMDKKVLEYFLTTEYKEGFKAACYQLDERIYLATGISVVDITKYGIPHVIVCYDWTNGINEITEHIKTHVDGSPDYIKHIKLKNKMGIYQYSDREWGLLNLGGLQVPKPHTIAILRIITNIFPKNFVIEIYVSIEEARICVNGEYFATVMGV